MDITVFVNTKKTAPLSKAATDEFVKRLRPYCNLHIIHTVKPDTPATGNNVQNFCITPASKSDKTDENFYCIKTISSEEFAEKIQTMTVNGISKIFFYIGYASKCTDNCLPFAITSVSLDLSMNLVVLCEQIYRAYTINNHITYHK